MRAFSILLVLCVLAVGMAPAATIDRTIPGVVSGSSKFNDVEAPPAVFDQEVNTKWLTGGVPTGWVQYQFLNNQAFAINSYAITSANDSADRDPKAWTLSGSNDGTTWTVVDTRSGETWSARFQRRAFKCTNTTPYKIYKLNVTQNNGSGNLMQFSELELIENGVSRTGYGKVSWSSQIGWNEGGLRPFDKLTGSKWLTAGGNSTGWLQYRFLGAGAYAVNGYSITSANDAPGRDPRDWTLQGSNDGTSWTILDTRVGESWQVDADEHRLERHAFEFNNAVAYSYYKLDVTSNNGDGGLMGFSEMELLERQLPGSAQYVSPAEIAFEVPVDAQLTWEAGTDPNLVVAGHYVYLGTNPGQMTLLTPTALPVETTSFAPTLATDMTYYWQVEEALDNGGVVRSAGDPNNVMGRVWRFSTKTSIVVINPETPQSTFAFPGESASFSIQATDPLGAVEGVNYQWFFASSTTGEGDGVALTEGAKYQGVTSATLTITNVGDADKGGYFCSAANSTGFIVYSNTANLYVKKTLAHWTLDAASYNDTSYADATGLGHDAVVDGTPIFVDGIVDGDKNAANAVANGAIATMDPNSCASAGAFNPSEETNAFSISAWVNWQGTAAIANGMIASKRDGWATADESYWIFMINDAGVLRIQAYAGGTVNTSNNTIITGQWHHVAMTYADGVARGYVDGLQASVGGLGLANGKAATFWIGRNESVGERFDGLLDDIKAFNYVLSPEEVVDLYHAENGLAVCLYGNPVGDLDESCKVDINDFAIMAQNWLSDGFYPNL